MEKQELTPEQQAENERLLRLLQDLSKSEAFQAWRDGVVADDIARLEASLASKEADAMPEVILRAKLKQLNSLKYIFHDVFEIVKQNLKEIK